MRFNGISLPDLPNSGYPHMYIVESGEAIKDYQLICINDGWSFAYNQTDAESTNYIVASGASGVFYDDYSGGWRDPVALDSSEGIVIWSNLLTPIWSNFDIINEDGSVYLAASEPVAELDYAIRQIRLRSYLMGLLGTLAGDPRLSENHGLSHGGRDNEFDIN